MNDLPPPARLPTVGPIVGEPQIIRELDDPITGGRMQEIALRVATDERDPDNPDDDGVRTVRFRRLIRDIPLPRGTKVENGDPL